MSANRERLLDVALHLFSSRGYEAVGIQEIVTAAGVTKPTLYHYFGSKQGLLSALLSSRLDPFDARLRAAAHFEGDLPLALNRITRTFFEFSAAQPAFYRLILAFGAAPPDSEAARAFAPFARAWRAQLEALFASATNTRVHERSRQLAATFVGMINTWIALSLQGNVALDADLTFQAVHQYMHGIYA